MPAEAGGPPPRHLKERRAAVPGASGGSGNCCFVFWRRPVGRVQQFLQRDPSCRLKTALSTPAAAACSGGGAATPANSGRMGKKKLFSRGINLNRGNWLAGQSILFRQKHFREATHKVWRLRGQFGSALLSEARRTAAGCGRRGLGRGGSGLSGPASPTELAACSVFYSDGQPRVGCSSASVAYR